MRAGPVGHEPRGQLEVAELTGAVFFLSLPPDVPDELEVALELPESLERPESPLDELPDPFADLSEPPDDPDDELSPDDSPDPLAPVSLPAVTVLDPFRLSVR